MCFSFSHYLRLFGHSRSIPSGRALHGKLITSGFHPDVYTSNHLVTMYLKFDRIDDARKVFDRMTERNLITWTTLISSFSKAGLAEEALDSLRLMVADGFAPNHYSYVGAISACASLGNVKMGKEIHGRIYRNDGEFNCFVSNSLVNLYGKCGLLGSARAVFDATIEPTLVSWTSLLSSYCQCGEYEECLKVFLLSQQAGVSFNEFSGATVLGACAALGDLGVGMQVHARAVQFGIMMDPFVVTALINIYVKCGQLDCAYHVFCEVNDPHLSAWNAVIGGHAQQGKGKKAIDLFHTLISSGLKPNERTFSAVLGSFSDATELKVGKQLHSLIIKLGFWAYTFVGNGIVDLYAKCGLLEESHKSFCEMDARDTVSWNALISGCLNSGHLTEAIELLTSMLRDGFEPSPFTYSNIFSACGDLPAIEWGRQTHCRIMKPGFHLDIVVGSALVDMYAKCGRLSEARRVFDNLRSKTLVSWNTMLVGYAHHGFGREALGIYDMMQRDEIKPNDITFIGVLSACAHVGLLEEGLQYFDSMTKDYKIMPRLDHLACMVSLFARKGQTERAFNFIKSFHMEPDKIVWRCLLSGCKTSKDLVIGEYAAKEILRIDPDDTSTHIMLSYIYAEAKMWNETAQMRRFMKEKALKKDPGYSWTELKNMLCYFGAGHSKDIKGSGLHEILMGLTSQLFDAGYVPAFAFQSQPDKYEHQEVPI